MAYSKWLSLGVMIATTSMPSSRPVSASSMSATVAYARS